MVIRLHRILGRIVVNQPIRALVGLLVAVMAVGAIVYGCNRLHAAAPPVLLDAQGACPPDPAVAAAHTGHLPAAVCRLSKFGNVETGEFVIPRGPWGLTWSYRCSRPMDFVVEVHLPSLDGVLPATSVYQHGRSGRGFQMETDNWQMTLFSVPTRWQNPQDLVVNSTCAWHVLVVKGDRATVADHVPDIPPFP